MRRVKDGRKEGREGGVRKLDTLRVRKMKRVCAFALLPRIRNLPTINADKKLKKIRLAASRYQ